MGDIILMQINRRNDEGATARTLLVVKCRLVVITGNLIVRRNHQGSQLSVESGKRMLEYINTWKAKYCVEKFQNQ